MVWDIPSYRWQRTNRFLATYGGFVETAVAVTSGSISETVPAGVYGVHVWLWGQGGWSTSLSAHGGGGGVAYRFFHVTPGDELIGSLTSTIGSYSQFLVNSAFMQAFSGAVTIGSGAVGGMAFGGSSNYQGGVATPNQGGAAGGNTTALAPCYRMRASDLNNIRSALSLAGLTATEACVTESPAWGSGARSEKFLGSSAGFGGGGVKHDGGAFVGGGPGVLLRYVEEAPNTMPASFLMFPPAGTQYSTVPLGATSVKAWVVGAGSTGGAAGGVAYKTYSVSPGDIITMTLDASSTTVTIDGVTITANAGSGNTGGTYSGGDGGANGGVKVGFSAGAIGGAGTTQGAPYYRRAAVDVSGLIAATNAAGHKGTEDNTLHAAIGSGAYFEKYAYGNAGFGGGGFNEAGATPGAGVIVLSFTGS